MLNFSIGIVFSSEGKDQIERCLTALQRAIKFEKEFKFDEIIIVLSSLWKNESIDLSQYRVIQSSTNNLAENRNLILASNRSSYLYMTDPDCLVSEVIFANYFKAVSQSEKVFAYAGPNIFTSENQKLNAFFEFLQITKLLSLGSTQIKRHENDCLVIHSPTCNILYRANCIKDFKFDSRFRQVGEDLDFHFQIFKISGKRIRYLPDCRVIHLQGGSFAEFFKKVFKYGIAQPRVMKKHPNLIFKNPRIWPLIILIFMMIFLAFGPDGSGRFISFLIFGAIFFFSILIAEAILQRKTKKIGVFFSYSTLTVLFYLIGQIRGIFPDRN